MAVRLLQRLEHTLLLEVHEHLGGAEAAPRHVREPCRAVSLRLYATGDSFCLPLMGDGHPVTPAPGPVVIQHTTQGPGRTRLYDSRNCCGMFTFTPTALPGRTRGWTRVSCVASSCPGASVHACVPSRAMGRN